MGVPGAARLGAWALGGAAAAAYATRRIAGRPEDAPGELTQTTEPAAPADFESTAVDAGLAAEVAELLPLLRALPKLNKHMKAMERSTDELPAIRKRLDQVAKSNVVMEKRMREIAHATSMMPELLHAVERMTKSIDKLADRLPRDKTR